MTTFSYIYSATYNNPTEVRYFSIEDNTFSKKYIMLTKEALTNSIFDILVNLYKLLHDQPATICVKSTEDDVFNVTIEYTNTGNIIIQYANNKVVTFAYDKNHKLVFQQWYYDMCNLLDNIPLNVSYILSTIFTKNPDIQPLELQQFLQK